MGFLLQFVNMVDDRDCFSNSDHSLHPWSKPHMLCIAELLLVNTFTAKFLMDICLPCLAVLIFISLDFDIRVIDTFN